MEDRIQQAVQYFKDGYNCSQAVALAFADIYDIDKNTLARIASPFGGGIGRMRETCGAACGMFILTGFEQGAINPKEPKQKLENYALVQTLADKFKATNGSLICAELQGMRKNKDGVVIKAPSCVKVVENAARIYAEYLMEKTNNAVVE